CPASHRAYGTLVMRGPQERRSPRLPATTRVRCWSQPLRPQRRDGFRCALPILRDIRDHGAVGAAEAATSRDGLTKVAGASRCARSVAMGFAALYPSYGAYGTTELLERPTPRPGGRHAAPA